MYFETTICWQGDDCSNMNYWMNSTHPAYGNCFTFNANGTGEGVENQKIYHILFFSEGDESDWDRVSKWTCAWDVSGSGYKSIKEQI